MHAPIERAAVRCAALFDQEHPGPWLLLVAILAIGAQGKL